MSMLQTDDCEVMNLTWLWKTKAPARWLHFFWLVRRDLFMTNGLRAKWKFEYSGVCQLCGTNEETTIHALRDCPEVANVWRALIPFEFWYEFFGSSVESWIEDNMRRQDLPNLLGEEC